MLEMCLRGEVLLVPEELFSYRIIKGKTGEQAAATLGPANARGPMSVNWGQLTGELCRSIRLAPLRATKKLSVMLQFLLEFCVLNPVVRMGLYREGLSGATDAWRRGQYVLGFGLLSLAAVVVPVEAVNIVCLRPLRYRQAKT
jgi:hypothetical protein